MLISAISLFTVCTLRSADGYAAIGTYDVVVEGGESERDRFFGGGQEEEEARDSEELVDAIDGVLVMLVGRPRFFRWASIHDDVFPERMHRYKSLKRVSKMVSIMQMAQMA